MERRRGRGFDSSKSIAFDADAIVVDSFLPRAAPRARCRPPRSAAAAAVDDFVVSPGWERRNWAPEIVRDRPNALGVARWRHVFRQAHSAARRPRRAAPSPSPAAALGAPATGTGRALLEAPAETRPRAFAGVSKARGPLRRDHCCRCWSSFVFFFFFVSVFFFLFFFFFFHLYFPAGGTGPARRDADRLPEAQDSLTAACEAAGAARERGGGRGGGRREEKKEKKGDGDGSGGGSDLSLFFEPLLSLPRPCSPKQLHRRPHPDARRPRGPAPRRSGAPEVRGAASGRDERAAAAFRLGRVLRCRCGMKVFLFVISCFLSLLSFLETDDKEPCQTTECI